jgi:hypoxanthine phosphoribosyltransferase
MPQQSSSLAAPPPTDPAEAEPSVDPAPTPDPPNPAPPDPALTVGATTFAHRAEAEFARLLTFYGIPWQYEPRSFALEWAADGHVSRMFSPDFYLHEYDLYIELTVMKQSLVRRKNRKLRRLRELYPDIQIKLLYRRDFHRLVAGLGLPVEVLVTSATGAPPGATGRAA